MEFEHVYTVTDYYDGPRGGVAMYHGRPHVYQSLWDDSEEPWDGTFLLRPVDAETLALVEEDWRRWLRWRNAFDEGRTVIDTHPVLPEDREDRERASPLLKERLAIDPETAIRAVGRFRVMDGQWQVCWEHV